MFKTALIASVAVANEFVPFTASAGHHTVPGIDGEFPDPPADDKGTLTFEQSYGAGENFNLNFEQTIANPDPPAMGGTEWFTMAGLATHPMTIDKVEVQCWLFGAPVYDTKFDPTTALATPGTIWTDKIPFDVPAAAPTAPTYDIQVCAKDAHDAPLFCMRTSFKFY